MHERASSEKKPQLRLLLMLCVKCEDPYGALDAALRLPADLRPAPVERRQGGRGGCVEIQPSSLMADGGTLATRGANHSHG